MVRLCVVAYVLFCGEFLSVTETVVGWPVCCCVGIIFWSVSWCLSRAYFSRYPPNGELARRLLSFYKCNIKIQSIFLMSQFKQDSGVLNIPF